MQKFWYNVTKGGEVKYGTTSSGSMVQIDYESEDNLWTTGKEYMQ